MELRTVGVSRASPPPPYLGLLGLFLFRGPVSKEIHSVSLGLDGPFSVCLHVLTEGERHKKGNR